MVSTIRYLLPLILSLAPWIVQAQHIFRSVEIPLTADSLYGHPILDVRVTCRFVGERGDTVVQEGFWDGGDIWRIRFSPRYGGIWRWSTESSRPDDAGLHAQSGSFTAVRLQRTGRFAEEGWPSVVPGNRYLTYESGEPWFWLACTAWEITWKSTRDQVEAYLDDRQRKEFSAIQIIVFSHQAMDERIVRNRNGAPAVLDSAEFTRLNPEYFRYLDTIITMANDRDMAVVLVPMWAAYSELYEPSGLPFTFDREEALTIARYVGARYAADNIVWITGGDNTYNTAERRDFFRDFAAVRKEAGSPDQLVTLHPSGWSASFDYFDFDTPWLDFHMYQSSHTAYGDFTWQAAQNGYRQTPPRPVLNGEANYEGIYHNLWTPGDTLHPDQVTWRITPDQVRQASYVSILSGALAGITYGGNGVWQWNVPGIFVTHRPEFLVEEAWKMPGSANMTVLKEIMQKIEWYSLVPRQELLVDRETFEDRYVAVAENDRAIIAYIPTGTTAITLAHDRLPDTLCYSWVDPVSGYAEPCRALDRSSGDTTDVRFVPPDTNDWVLLIDRAGITEIPLPGGVSYAVELQPHPIADQGELSITIPYRTAVRIELYSMRGEQVWARKAEGIYSYALPVRDLPPGIYFFRIEIRGKAGERWVEHRRFLVIGRD